MARKHTTPNPIIRIQRERVARFLDVKRGDGDHILYHGYLDIDNEARMDVFMNWRDEWENCCIGLPTFILVDITGSDIRFASADETSLILRSKLPRRKPEKEDKEVRL